MQISTRNLGLILVLFASVDVLLVSGVSVALAIAIPLAIVTAVVLLVERRVDRESSGTSTHLDPREPGFDSISPAEETAPGQVLPEASASNPRSLQSSLSKTSAESSGRAVGDAVPSLVSYPGDPRGEPAPANPPGSATLDLFLSMLGAPDDGRQKSGVAGVAVFGSLALAPLLELIPVQPGRVIDTFERMAARGNRADALDGMLRAYPLVPRDQQRRITIWLGSLVPSEGQPAASAEPGPRLPGSVPRRPSAAQPVAAPKPPQPRIVSSVDGDLTASFVQVTGPPAGRWTTRSTDQGLSGQTGAEDLTATTRTSASAPGGATAESIAELLRESGSPLRARTIARRLTEHFGRPVARVEVNRVLYGNLDTFSQNANWEWWPGALPATDRPLVPQDGYGAPITHPEALPRPRPLAPGWVDDRLFDWQRRALETWSKRGERGIVRAVTGAGKTRIGLAAIERQLSRPGGHAAVLVPTIALMDQWAGELSRWLKVPVAKLGRSGGNHADSLRDFPVVVYVVNSAARSLPMESREIAGQGGSVLLVADECHRYGAPSFDDALHGEFDSTLGLTATAERPGDYGMENSVLPAIGDVIYDYAHREALADRVIAPFEVGFIGLTFTPEERSIYDELSEQILKLATEIKRRYPEIRQGKTYFADLQRVLTETGDPLVGGYVKRVSDRRGLLGEVEAREQFVRWLVRDVRHGARTFLFHDTIAGAEWLAQELTDAGIPAAAHHSELSPSVRETILGAFRNGSLQAITAARTLDEGIDVPDASVAVIVSGSSVRRQRIQRAGRVLRPGLNKQARVIVLYVRGARDDPAARAGGDLFRDEMADLGRLAEFVWPEEAGPLAHWLEPAGSGASPLAKAPLLDLGAHGLTRPSLGIDFDMTNSGPG